MPLYLSCYKVGRTPSPLRSPIKIQASTSTRIGLQDETKGILKMSFLFLAVASQRLGKHNGKRFSPSSFFLPAFYWPTPWRLLTFTSHRSSGNAFSETNRTVGQSHLELLERLVEKTRRAFVELSRGGGGGFAAATLPGLFLLHRSPLSLGLFICLALKWVARLEGATPPLPCRRSPEPLTSSSRCRASYTDTDAATAAATTARGIPNSPQRARLAGRSKDGLDY